MNRRYQVFVSSTYTDLLVERQAVFNALLSMPCIPAGMEWFPAQTEEQWRAIRKVIDVCDVYVLIIGGRYGSVSEDGLSYTEREFDYAVARNLPVLVFPHKDPEELSMKRSETSPSMQNKLSAFRQKAMTGRTVKFWTNPDGLAAVVSIAVHATLADQRGSGWVRADSVDAVAGPPQSLSVSPSTLHRNDDSARPQADPVCNGLDLDSTVDIPFWRQRYAEVKKEAQKAVVQRRELLTWLTGCFLTFTGADWCIGDKSARDLDFHNAIHRMVEVNYPPREKEYIGCTLNEEHLAEIEHYVSATGIMYRDRGLWSLTKRGREVARRLHSQLHLAP